MRGKRKLLCSANHFFLRNRIPLYVNTTLTCGSLSGLAFALEMKDPCSLVSQIFLNPNLFDKILVEKQCQNV